MSRSATVHRKTKETDIHLSVAVDGQGDNAIKTGIGFFDHMLDLLGRHGMLNLSVEAKGDLHIDYHHTVEDVGICLGQALKQALGDLKGIYRYGEARIPMSEALASVVLDICNRPYFVFQAKFPAEKTGDFNADLVKEFFEAVANNAGITLHIYLDRGENLHHCIEAMFKAFARALDRATQIDIRQKDLVPSTKGML